MTRFLVRAVRAQLEIIFRFQSYSNLIIDALRVGHLRLERLMINVLQHKLLAARAVALKVSGVPNKNFGHAQRLSVFDDAKSFGRVVHPSTELRIQLLVDSLPCVRLCTHIVARQTGTYDARMDARVHSSIVCASLSCHNVRTEAYAGETVDEQLNAQFSGWMNNTSKGLSVVEDGKTLRMSKIFVWYAADFERNGSSGKEFVLKHIDHEPLKTQVANTKSINY